MIKWPNRAKSAIRKLFEPLQEIDVYVEDINDEAFYRALLKSATNDEVKVARVFALGGRESVIDAAKNHNHQHRRALFIIDGDLPWVRGESNNNIIGLYCHEAYCVENLLLCEKALSFILSQEHGVIEDQARSLLNYDNWVHSIQLPLLELFSAFATSHKFAPSIPTVAQGVEIMCSQQSGGKALDPTKVNSAKIHALNVAENVVGIEVSSSTYEEILNRLKNLPSPLYGVSGKDFLLPLIAHHIKSLGHQIKRKALRMRLVSAGDMTRFGSLANAIKQVARGDHLL